MLEFNFKGKNVIVTGGAKGLGKSISEEFAKAGANVVIADIDLEGMKETAQELSKYGTKIVAYKIDVSKYQEFEKLAEYVNTNLGSVDILINNAGICTLMPTLSMDVSLMDKILDINIKGSLYGARACLKYMKEKGYGRIVNMSSIAAKLSGANTVAYSASKAAIISMTASLAREFAKDNINVNCILPGIIRTPLWEQMLVDFAGEDEAKRNETFAAYTNDIPNGKPQDPVDIAKMALFLCSEEARYVTAQNIGVDGGHTF